MTLEQLRFRAGLTQEQLAEKVGVARITISSWENAASQPKIQYMRPLADALGVTTAVIYDAIQFTAQQARQNRGST